MQYRKVLMRGLIALLWVVAAYGAESQTSLVGLVKDFAGEVGAVRFTGHVFLNLEDIRNRVPVDVISDDDARFGVLAGPGDCAGFYYDDETEFREIGGKRYLSADVLARAFDAKIGRAGKRNIEFRNERMTGWLRPGSEVGRLAPGFVLRDADSAVVKSSTARADAGMIVAFVRSGRWDPLSIDMLKKLSANREEMRAHHFTVVAIHGYGCGEAKSWADSLKLTIPVLADKSAAVMRGYGAFDKGHLPRCAVVVVGADGVIRWRRDYGAGEAGFDVNDVRAQATP
jgi:peroxiredoxin